MSSNAGCPTHMPTCSFSVAFEPRSRLMSLVATGGHAVLSLIYGSAYPLVMGLLDRWLSPVGVVELPIRLAVARRTQRQQVVQVIRPAIRPLHDVVDVQIR